MENDDDVLEFFCKNALEFLLKSSWSKSC